MSDERLPLNSLQGWMQNALVFPGQVARDEAEHFLDPSVRLTGIQRLAIYQRSYYLRLLKCMREQFPALCHALGEDLFNDFAREYLQAYPSRSYTLYDLGGRFPRYLDETRPDRDEAAESRESWVDFMVDLARFEWQVFGMFDAPGHEGKPFADDDVPDNRLRLQPCFALGDYRFPVAWYYHEVRKGSKPQFPPQERQMVALVRKDYLTHTLPLTAPHYTFLKALDGGMSVAEALGQVAHELGMPQEQVVESWAAADGIRKRWIQAGFFVVVDSSDDG